MRPSLLVGVALESELEDDEPVDFDVEEDEEVGDEREVEVDVESGPASAKIFASGEPGGRFKRAAENNINNHLIIQD